MEDHGVRDTWGGIAGFHAGNMGLGSNWFQGMEKALASGRTGEAPTSEGWHNTMAFASFYTNMDEIWLEKISSLQSYCRANCFV